MKSYAFSLQTPCPLSHFQSSDIEFRNGTGRASGPERCAYLLRFPSPFRMHVSPESGCFFGGVVIGFLYPEAVFPPIFSLAVRSCETRPNFRPDGYGPKNASAATNAGALI